MISSKHQNTYVWTEKEEIIFTTVHFSFLLIIILILESFLTTHELNWAWGLRKQGQVEKDSNWTKFS